MILTLQSKVNPGGKHQHGLSTKKLIFTNRQNHINRFEMMPIIVKDENRLNDKSSLEIMDFQSSNIESPLPTIPQDC